MENKITDINDLVAFLAATGMKPLFRDEIWQCYGYKKRPSKGSIWSKMFPKAFELENFISREILTMGLVDVLNGIKKSAIAPDNKLLISIGVIDQFLSTTKHLFTTDLFMENLFSTYTSFLKSEKSKLHEAVILKAKNVLGKKSFARFMVGTIKLLAVESADDFLLKSDYVKDVVEKSATENKLKISMSDENCKKYTALVADKVLNV